MQGIYAGAFSAQPDEDLSDLGPDELLEMVGGVDAPAGYVLLGDAHASRFGQELAGWARRAESLLGRQSNIYMLVDRPSAVNHTWVETKYVGDTAFQFVSTHPVSGAGFQNYEDTLGHGRGHIAATATVITEPTGRATFDALADDWLAETRFESNLASIFSHEKYMQIVGLGPDAIPFLLERLPNEPWRWDGALRFISRSNPAVKAVSEEEAVAAWLDWARQQALA